MAKREDGNGQCEVRIVYINSISEFIEGLNKEESNGVLWFRGHSNVDYRLLPSLYRKTKAICRLSDNENNLREQFAARNLHLLQNSRPQNDMEWLCVMQHYNVATRLLDWTENAMTAFLFALEALFKNEEYDRTVLPCVWTLKPYGLNKMLELEEIPNLSFIGEEDWWKRLEKTNKKNVGKMKEGFIVCPGSCKSAITPIAVLHPLNNDRIRAQFGAFTLFPIFRQAAYDRKNRCEGCPNPIRRNEEKFNMYALEKMKSCETYLKKYVILNPEKVYKELKDMGFRRSMLYPEMPNTSVEIEENIFR